MKSYNACLITNVANTSHSATLEELEIGAHFSILVMKAVQLLNEWAGICNKNCMTAKWTGMVFLKSVSVSKLEPWVFTFQ